MKATELRIGNYIYGLYECEIDKGNGIIEDVECQDVVKYAGFEPMENYIYTSNGRDDYESFNGIPLTEEWLLKFGFEKYFNEDDIDYDLILELDEITIQGEWNNKTNTIIGVQIIDVVQSIKYIHQLQNLYHALTNEELKIKE